MQTTAASGKAMTNKVETDNIRQVGVDWGYVRYLYIASYKFSILMYLKVQLDESKIDVYGNAFRKSK